MKDKATAGLDVLMARLREIGAAPAASVPLTGATMAQYGRIHWAGHIPSHAAAAAALAPHAAAIVAARRTTTKPEN